MSADDPLADAIGRLAAGESRALDAIYRATAAKLFGICLRITRDRSAAEDALQDVYVSLSQAAGRYDPARASPHAWLGTFARNRAIDRLRRGKRLAEAAPIEAADEVADAAPLADALLSAGQERARVHSCLEALDDPQRSTIRTAFFDGVTYAEIAERQGQPLGTVKSWVRRGLAKLKICLEA